MLCGCCRIAAAVGLGPMSGMAVAEDSGRQRLNPATATKPRVAGAVGSRLLALASCDLVSPHSQPGSSEASLLI
jgi:hypothetical protein